jgi:excisionase family DNA binding protein
MDKLFSTKEVAARIGVSPVTVRQWLLRGKLKPRPKIIGGGYLFTEADLQRLSQRTDNRRK